MNTDTIIQWVDALRSGDYKQCKRQLVTLGGSHNSDVRVGGHSFYEETSYCCLGVLAHLNTDIGYDDLADAMVFEQRVYSVDSGEMEVVKVTTAKAFPSDDFLHAIGLTNSIAAGLAEMNDAGSDFSEIADAIERMAADGDL